MSRRLAFTEKDIDVMARTMWGEARRDGPLGLQAAANVIANRAAISEELGGHWWGNGIEGVAKRFRNGQHQFSCWDKSDPNYNKIMALSDNDPTFVMAKRIARGVLTGAYYDNTEGADHYHSRHVVTGWSNPAQRTAQIKNHVFENKSGYDPRDLRQTGRLMATNTSLSDFLFGKKEQPLPAASLAARQTSRTRITEADLPKDGIGKITFRDEVFPEHQREQAAIMLARVPPDLVARPEEIIFEKGYTVSRMAVDLGIDKKEMSAFYKAFKEANPQLGDINKVRAGVAYNVPSFQKDADPDATPTVMARLNPSDVLKSHGDEDIIVKVRRGDTLTRITSRAFPDLKGEQLAAKVADVAEENNLKDPDRIRPGQILTIGAPA